MDFTIGQDVETTTDAGPEIPAGAVGTVTEVTMLDSGACLYDVDFPDFTAMLYAWQLTRA